MLPFTLYDLNEKYFIETLDVEPNPNTVSGSGNENLGDVYTTAGNGNLVNGPFFEKHLALRIVVGITCCLSMLGSMLIILSYCMIREIQTKSRQILVHLSVADFGVACCNFVGVSVYFDQYIRWCPAEEDSTIQGGGENYSKTLNHHSTMSCQTLQGFCEAQAFIAAFSTLASVLWTLTLALYIYCLVVHSKSKAHFKVLYMGYLLCWGLPLFISIWLIITDRLGYSPHGGSGWCTLKVDSRNGQRDTFAVVFGNDLWIYLTFIMVSILYFTTHFYIKFQLKNSSSLLHVTNLATVTNADTKFILIPFFFLLLRMWTMILVILLVYARAHPPHIFSLFLLYAAGIGDSGQGFVNAFLFCVFTPRVRQHFVFLLRKVCSCTRRCPILFSRRGSDVGPRLMQQSLSSTFPILHGRLSTSNSDGSRSGTDSSSEETRLVHKTYVQVTGTKE